MSGGIEEMIAHLVGQALDERTDTIATKIADLVAERAALAAEPLQPLAKILTISHRAALGRLERDAELRGLGCRLGRSLLFRASEVRQLLAQRQRERCGTAGTP